MNKLSLRFFALLISIGFIYSGLVAQVSINEWMADNSSNLADAAGEFDDWIELYNDGASAINLNGYYLSDDIAVPDKFQISADLIIDPGGYYIFWADNDLAQGPNHTNFKLGSGGEEIILSDPSLTALSSVLFGPQVSDQSMGAFPNGSTIYFTFSTPTPESANSNNGNAAGVVKPSFNIDGGFFAAAQNIVLTHPDNTVSIYYTLNGDAPDETDNLYTGPILINATTVVRAVATKLGSPLSVIASNIYYINESYSLPTLSIVGDPADFFDATTGIYANPTHGGSDWERFTQVQYFEAEELKFEIDCGIRIQGNSSVTLPKKSFRLFFESSYGDKWLDYPLFDGNAVKRFRNLVLRSGYDDDLSNPNGTLLRDPFGSDKYNEAGGFVSDRKWAVVTINGDYWGIYDVRESVNDHFIESHIGTPDFDLIRFTADGPILKEGTMDDWDSFTNFINSNDFSNPASYAQAEAMIDMDDFINLLAFIHNDGYKSWTYGVSAYKEKAAGKKWKFTIWDLDRSIDGPYFNSFEDYEEDSGLLWANFIPGALVENEGFRNRVLNRTADLLNTTFKPATAKADLDVVKNQIIGEIPDELALWSTMTFQDWENTIVSELDEFFDDRGPILRDQAIDKYLLGGINEIEIDKTGMGRLKVNTIYPGPLPWSGEYFEDVPITITAFPDAGYIFDDWSDSSLPDDPQVSLDFAGTKDLTAHFIMGNTEMHDIIINEIHYHPADATNSGDWVEIVNRGTQSADLSGWYLEDESGNYFSLPAGTVLAAGGYLVLAEDLDLFEAEYPLVTNVIGAFGKLDQFSFGLSNAGELLNIKNANASFIDPVDYNDKAPWPIEADGLGPSLQLIGTNLDNALAGNWAAAEPTPGIENFATIKSPQQITFNAVSDHYALDAPFELAATSDAGLPVTLTLISGPAVLNGTTITLDGIAGTLVVEATQEGNDDYYPANPVQRTIDVLKELQDINFDFISDQLPSADPITIIASTDSNLPLSFDLISGPASLNGNIINLNGTTGEVRIEISQGGNQTYEAADNVQIIFDVTKLDQDIDLVPISDHFTLDPDFELDASVNSNLALSYEIISGPASNIGNVVSLDGVQGEVLVRVFQNGDIDHNEAEHYESFDVFLTDQIIDFPPIDNHLETDVPFNISASSNSGLAITFDIISGPASIIGNTITLDGVSGTVMVRARQGGNNTYAFAEVIRTFVVSETVLLDQTISWTAIADKLTIDLPFEVMAVASSNMPVSYAILSGPATVADNVITLDGIAGVVVVEASQIGDDDYYPTSADFSFNVLRQDQIISWTTIADKYTFDDPFEIMAATTSGLDISYSVESGPATIFGNMVTLDGTPGTVVMLAEQAGDDDFNPADSESISFEVIEVTQAAQNIDFENIDDQLTDAAPLTLVATASSGLDVELSLVSGPAVLNGNILTLDGVIGFVTVAANQAGDNFFLAASEVTQTFEVKLANSIYETELAKGINIYPNPAQEVLYISADEVQISAINVFNVLGEKMESLSDLSSPTQLQITIANFIGGCYTLEIIFEGGERIGRLFIKE